MIEIAFLAILILSLTGLGIIIFRKIPFLLELPQVAPALIDWKNLSSMVKGTLSLENLSIEIILQKILSRVRILILKTDTKTWNWLQRLKARSQKNKFGDNDNYWQEVRKPSKK